MVKEKRTKKWPIWWQSVKVLAPQLQLIYNFFIGIGGARHFTQRMDGQLKSLQGEHYAEEKLLENRRLLSRHLQIR
jgi:hypothetical protein